MALTAFGKVMRIGKWSIVRAMPSLRLPLASIVAGVLFAFFTFPSSAFIRDRDLVALCVVGIPAFGWWLWRRVRIGPRSASCGALCVFLFFLAVFASGPTAARGQLEEAIAYCETLSERLRRKFKKQGRYPRMLRARLLGRPRHVRFHKNGCRYHRRRDDQYTFTLWRTDRRERIFFQSWRDAWVTESGEEWPG